MTDDNLKLGVGYETNDSENNEVKDKLVKVLTDEIGRAHV